MTSELNRTDLARFAYGVFLRSACGDWAALTVEEDARVDETATALAEQLEQFTERPAGRVATPATPEGLLAALEKSAAPSVVIAMKEGWVASDWGGLDLQRAKLPRDRALVFVMSKATLGQFAKNAPNLASLLAASVGECGADESEMTDEERTLRLQLLREEMQRTDEEILALAREKRLPPDPVFAEWLLLLGHGELLEREANDP